MRVIELNGAGWKTPLDFSQSLFDGIEQGYPHGMSPDAFIESMIYRGMGGVEPPYSVRIISVGDVPNDVKDHIKDMIFLIKKARQERFERDGIDIEVSISAPELGT